MSSYMKYLYYVEVELYTIKISPREDGHYHCIYKIMNDIEHILFESSPKKIFLRLVNAFRLHEQDFNASQIHRVVNDLEIIAKKFKLPEDYVKTKMLQLKK